jgi:hypothetical protein
MDAAKALVDLGPRAAAAIPQIEARLGLPRVPGAARAGSVPARGRRLPIAIMTGSPPLSQLDPQYAVLREVLEKLKATAEGARKAAEERSPPPEPR